MIRKIKKVKKKTLKEFDAYYVPYDEEKCVTIEAKSLKDAKKKAEKLLKTEDYLCDMCLDTVVEIN